MKKNCVICGKEFEAKGRTITCGIICSKANHYNLSRIIYQNSYHPIMKTCIICGKEFEARGNLKTCSFECREKRNRYHIQLSISNVKHKRRMNKHSKVCVICGNNFFAYKKSITCSKECSKKRKQKWKLTRKGLLSRKKEAKRNKDYVFRKRKNEYQKLWRSTNAGHCNLLKRNNRRNKIKLTKINNFNNLIKDLQNVSSD